MNSLSIWFNVNHKPLRTILFVLALFLSILSLVRTKLDYSPFYEPAYRAGILYYYLFSFIVYLILATFIKLTKSENGLKLGIVFSFLFTIVINFFISIDDFAKLY